MKSSVLTFLEGVPFLRRRPSLSTLFVLTCFWSAANGTVLEQVRAAPEGSWLRANQNAVSSVWTPAGLRDPLASSGLDRIIYAWSSFAWDSSRSSMILYGGGHANYGGNDVYTWNGNSLLWTRSALPSDLAATSSLGTYGYPVDGPFAAPPAAHTYDNTVYLRTNDRYLTFGGAAWNTGGVYIRPDGSGGNLRTGPYVFNPNLADGNKVGGTTGSSVDRSIAGGQMWQNRDAFATNPSPVKPSSFVDGFSDTTVIGGKDVVFVGGSLGSGTRMGLFKYTINDVNNPSLDTWQQVGAPVLDFNLGNTSGAYDPDRNIFVRTGEPGTLFSFWDLATGSASNADKKILAVDLTGGAMPTDLRGYGLAYDQTRKQYIFWNGGANVFSLTPPAENFKSGLDWTVQRLAVTSSTTPGPLDTTNVLGKWQYAEDLDAFVGLQGPSTGDVWIYKPQGWSDPALAVPEPSTYVLILAGLLAIVFKVRQSHGPRRQ